MRQRVETLVGNLVSAIVTLSKSLGRAVESAQRFIEVLTEFVDTTEPAEVAPERWREMLQKGERVAPT